MYAFLKGLMRFMTRTYLVGLFTVEGQENVPRTGPLIVCPNHFATLDPPMVPAFLPRPSRALALRLQLRFQTEM